MAPRVALICSSIALCVINFSGSFARTLQSLDHPQPRQHNQDQQLVDDLYRLSKKNMLDAGMKDAQMKEILIQLLDQHTARSSPGVQCPTARAVVDPGAPIYERALCPWKWKMDYQPDRRPQVLPTAQCLCPGRSNMATFECHELEMNVQVEQPKGTPKNATISLACIAVHMLSRVEPNLHASDIQEKLLPDPEH